MRKYQNQQLLPTIQSQPFNQCTRQLTQNDQQSQNAEKKFDDKCSYCTRSCHRKQECLLRIRIDNIHTAKEDAIEPLKRSEGKQKHNLKLVCQICGYTGHLARDCYQRVSKPTNIPFGQVLFANEENAENRNHRRELKKQQQAINQMKYTTQIDN